jgi:hypothetical protein
MKLVLAAFLVAHGLIHASFLTPAPPRTADGPQWPFELARSWLVTVLDLDPAVVRPMGVALVVATVVLLGAAAFATLGWLPSAWSVGLVTAGAAASLVTLGLYFHPWLVLGLAIDLVLLWAVLVAGWAPVRIGGAP